MDKKTNYQKLGKEIISTFAENQKPSLLLHSCCAPCSTYCLEYLTEFFKVTVFYYNPNITDEEEYLLRKEEQQRYIKEVYGQDVGFIEGDYEVEEFYSISKGKELLPEGGERCYSCYALRLGKTCEEALKGAFDFFTTTLSISPYKNAEWLNEIGFNLQKATGQKYFPADFKKNDGYKRSTELSKSFGIYRQDYCGCVFSKEEIENKRKNKI